MRTEYERNKWSMLKASKSLNYLNNARKITRTIITMCPSIICTIEFKLNYLRHHEEATVHSEFPFFFYCVVCRCCWWCRLGSVRRMRSTRKCGFHCLCNAKTLFLFNLFVAPFFPNVMVKGVYRGFDHVGGNSCGMMKNAWCAEAGKNIRRHVTSCKWCNRWG